MNGNRNSALPFFLTGLGIGIALSLFSLIGRKVKDGEDWMKDKAATAKDYVLTHTAGLHDGVKRAAEVIGRS